MSTTTPIPFKMKPIDRQLRSIEKLNLLTEFLKNAIIIDVAQAAALLDCGERSAQKTLKSHADRGFLECHKIPFCGSVWGFSRRVYKDVNGRYFDPRRTAEQCSHTLACGWIYLKYGTQFSTWKNDSDTHAVAKELTQRKVIFDSIPDAVGLDDDKKTCVYFECELHYKNNSRRARFYCACMSGERKFYLGFKLQKVIFFCSSEKHKNRLKREIENTIYQIDGDEFLIKDTAFFRRFEFFTVADLRPKPPVVLVPVSPSALVIDPNDY